MKALLNVRTRVPKPQPTREDLPFTLGDIRAAIPPSLFKADMATSWYYIVRDFALLAAVAWVTHHALSLTESTYVRVAIWTAYTVVQGMTGFGVWVIGHECGHQAYFGDGHALNDPVGYVLHSFFCDPYHSWRVTHATHHRYTNHVELDTVFPPKDYPVFFEIGEAFPPLHLLYVLFYLTVGWPMYIFFNLEGHRYETTQSHYDPGAPMFQPKDRVPILISTAGVLAMLGVLGACVWSLGWVPVATYYGLTWWGTHMFLVLVTFLQHTDPRLPHYEDSDNFTFVKGAIATVDRDYGALANNLMHHITDAHVVHHIFSRVPFYRAKEMTPYVAKLLGTHYKYDDRNLFVQLWESWWAHQSSFLYSAKWQAANPTTAQAKKCE